MANLTEAIFLIQFILLTGIFFYKLYNALNGFDKSDWDTIIILFVAGIFIYGLNMVLTILSYDSLVISQLSKFEILPFLLIIIFTIIEVLNKLRKMNYRERYTQNGR